ncbi:MAG: prephenate dehydrogenase/arogenate dehydrogenase family protein, partial [Pseudomonadota bacterium]
MAADPRFGRIAVVGGGLIGSSVLRAAAAFGVGETRVLIDADPNVCARAEALGLADVVAGDAAAAASADLVILCTPVGACGPAAAALGPHLQPGTILSDVGSVKRAVIRAVAPHLPAGVVFVPGHPVAGTEHSGPDAGFAELFVGRRAILTPDAGADPEPVDRVAAFWRRLGANVEIMDPDRHDLVLAVTSHIPHLIAYTIVDTASDMETVSQQEVFAYAAGGFRDFTRIAASDPTMWRDIFLNNRDAVLD